MKILSKTYIKYLIIISNFFLNDYLLCGNGWNKLLGIATLYTLDIPRLEFQQGRNILYPSRPTPEALPATHTRSTGSLSQV